MVNLDFAEIMSAKSLADLVRLELITYRPVFSNVGINVNAKRNGSGFVRKYHLYLNLEEGRNLNGRLRTPENNLDQIFNIIRSTLPKNYRALDLELADSEEGPVQHMQIIPQESIE